MPKAISAVIAVIMLLMITVALAGMAYVWTAALTTSTTQAGTEQVEQFIKQVSDCMKIESIYSNKIILFNCGTGIISNETLAVYIDNIPYNISLDGQIQNNERGTLNISGLWQLSLGEHSLRITNGMTEVVKTVEAIPHESAVGVWKFDEGAGNTAYDSSGNGNTGTLYSSTTVCSNPPTAGCPTWTDGKFGNALNFDGTNDYVDVTNDASLNSNSLSVSFWVNFASLTLPQGILGKWSDPTGQGWRFFLNGGGRIEFDAVGEIANAVASVVSANTWYHIVGTFDESAQEVRLYENGVLKNTKTGITTMLNNATVPIIIGSRSINYFNGIIDEVRIFRQALTPDEIVWLKMK